MSNLFAYGTLMCEEIMEEAAGHCPEAVQGVLGGYVRLRVKGEPYPGLVPRQSNIVEGILYLGLPVTAWNRLDLFEGEMYAREPVSVRLKNGTTAPAETYVVRPEFRDQLEEGDWDYANFLLQGKEDFQRRYGGSFLIA